MNQTEITMRTYPQFVTALYENIGELVKLNLLFLIFSLPVVTLPASYTAMTMSMQKLARGEVRHIWSDFRETFRRCFWRSIPCGAAVFGPAALCVYVVPFYRAQLAYGPVFYLPLVLSCITAGVMLMAGFYAFPMLAAVGLPLGGILKNAVSLVFIRLWQSLLCLAVLAVLTVLVIVILPVSVVLLLTIYFSLSCAIASYAGWGGILDYVLKEAA